MNQSALLLLFGVFIGVTTVLFGFGGGFVVVPVLYVLASRRPDAMHVAVATSTAVMIVNASVATFTSRSSGLLIREYLRPLMYFVTIGAAAGAVAATHVPEALLRLLFITYVAAAIADSLARRGFLLPCGAPRPLGRAVSVADGVGIGAVAAFLGVGGSVMTVPMLRRKGLPMTSATAMANPLSVPIALAGTCVYAIPVDGSAGTLGYLDLTAAATLLTGSLPTIAVARKLVRHIPDRLHSIAFIALLAGSLAVITFT